MKESLWILNLSFPIGNLYSNSKFRVETTTFTVKSYWILHKSILLHLDALMHTPGLQAHTHHCVEQGASPHNSQLPSLSLRGFSAPRLLLFLCNEHSVDSHSRGTQGTKCVAPNTKSLYIYFFPLQNSFCSLKEREERVGNQA